MSLSDYGFSAGPFSTIFILAVLLIAVAATLGITLYFIRALAYYELSRSSKLKNPWYGFIPFFSDISCGNIAAGSSKSKIGKVMAVLSVLSCVLAVAFIAMYGAAVIKIVFAADAAMADGLTELPTDTFSVLSSALLPAILLIAVSSINKILRIVSVFRIYRKFAPKTAFVFIIIGIILPITEPIFLFCIRRNSLTNVNEESLAGFDFKE